MAQNLSRRSTPAVDGAIVVPARAILEPPAKSSGRRTNRFSLAPILAIGTIGLVASWILLSICCTISPVVLTWTESLI